VSLECVLIPFVSYTGNRVDVLLLVEFKKSPSLKKKLLLLYLKNLEP